MKFIRLIFGMLGILITMTATRGPIRSSRETVLNFHVGTYAEIAEMLITGMLLVYMAFLLIRIFPIPSGVRTPQNEN